MKRRSQTKPKRDREVEMLRKLTTLSLTQRQMQERLLADKAALEARLKELFAERRGGVSDPSELIRSISAELRMVKTSLKLVGHVAV